MTPDLSRRDLGLHLGGLGIATLAAASAHSKGPSLFTPPSRQQTVIQNAYLKYRKLDEGQNAPNPALAKVSPTLFGIALADVGGARFSTGDVAAAFSIQSISKVCTLALVLQQGGEEAIEQSVGVNATGRVYNSIEAIEARRGKNMNPFVTPGAIATTGNVRGANPDEIWGKILEIHNDFAGRRLEVDQEVYRASSRINERNRAAAFLMSAYGRFPGDPMSVVDLYTRQCSISVTADDLASIAATLANHGRNPMTQKQVIDARHVPSILALMATAGLYNVSGQWLFRTGLPAKSGVGGGLIAVAPGRYGVAAFAPPLDAAGTSVRAQRAIVDIARAIGGNPYDVVLS